MTIIPWGPSMVSPSMWNVPGFFGKIQSLLLGSPTKLCLFCRITHQIESHGRSPTSTFMITVHYWLHTRSIMSVFRWGGHPCCCPRFWTSKHRDTVVSFSFWATNSTWPTSPNNSVEARKRPWQEKTVRADKRDKLTETRGCSEHRHWKEARE